MLKGDLQVFVRDPVQDRTGLGASTGVCVGLYSVGGFLHCCTEHLYCHLLCIHLLINIHLLML